MNLPSKTQPWKNLLFSVLGKKKAYIPNVLLTAPVDGQSVYVCCMGRGRAERKK